MSSGFVPGHVHDRTCDRVATYTFVEEGVTRTWGVGAGCMDTRETLRDHFYKWRPQARLLGIEIETWDPTTEVTA